MMKKVRVIHWLGLFVLVLLLGTPGRADVAADLKQAEGLYKAAKYTAAEQIYQKILQNESGDAETVYQAGRMLPRVYLATDRLPQAQEAVQQLLTKSAQHERLPHALHDIVDQAKALKKTPQAGQIYQSLLTAQPNGPQAIWLKMGVAITNAQLGDDKAVDAVLQNIIAQHSSDERAVEALGQTAWAYRKLEQPAKARTVYRYVVDNWPKADRAVFSQRGVILSSIALDDYASAEAGVRRLLAEHADSKYMAEIVRTIAQDYHTKGKLEPARTLYQYVVDKHPKTPEALSSQRDLVLCAIEQKDGPAMKAALEKLLAALGDNKQASSTVQQIATRCYRAGDVVRARDLHQYVVDHWPASNEAFTAQRDLVICCIDQQDKPAAEAALEKLLAQAGKNPQGPHAIQQIAARCYREGNVARARELHQYVVDHWPGNTEVLLAYRDLAICCIDQQDEAATEAALQKLVTGYGTDSRLPGAVARIGERYRRKGQYAKARNVHQYVVNQFPKSKEALSSQRNAILCSIALNDEPQIEAGLQMLLTQFAENSDIVPVLDYVADRLPEGKQTERARVYEYIIDHHPNHELVISAKARLGQTKIRQGDDAGAEALFQEILSKYANHPKFGEALSTIGLSYYERTRRRQGGDRAAHVEDYRKAIEMWERIIRDLPPSDITPQAYYHSAVVYSQELGEYAKGIEYYQKVVDNWPDYAYAWHAQSLIGKYLQKLKSSGQLSEAEANPRIKQAYNALIQKYPDSNSVPAIALNLGRMELRKGQGAEVIRDLETFLERENGRAPKSVVRGALHDLSQAYEWAHEPDRAAQARRMVQEMERADPEFCKVQSGVMFHAGHVLYVQGLQYKKQGHSEQARDHFRKAIAEWERVIAELPPSPAYSPRAFYMTAVCCGQELGEHEKSAEYLQQIVENWPDYKYARDAQLMVARNYELLGQSSGAPDARIEARLESAYKAIVEKYPDSKSSPRAAFALGFSNFRRKNWTDAARYLELFLQRDYGQAPTVAANVVRHLAYAYEQMEDREKAAEKYRMFIKVSDVLDPDDPRIKAAKAALEKLEGTEK